MKQYPLILFVLCLTAMTAIAQELPPLLPINVPEIDGRIGEKEWSQARYLGKLTSREGSALPDTEAWVSMDRSHLYFAIRCKEPRMEQVKTNILPEEQKASVWTDDSVELFVDVGNTAKSIYHLVSNINGTYYDSQIIGLKEVPSSWNSEAVIRTSAQKEGWEVEIAIPMLGMGHQIAKGEVISINVGRNRFAGGKHEIGSLAKGHFVFPQHFLSLLAEGPIEGTGYMLISTKRGPFFKDQAGAWEFQLFPQEEKTAKFSITFPEAEPPVEQSLSIPAGQRFITIPIPVGQAAAYQHCIIRPAAEASPLYASQYEVRTFVEPTRVSITARPLFETLLEPRPNGLSKGGILTWPHELARPAMSQLPYRTGSTFHRDDPYRQYQKDRAILWFMGATLTPERMKKFDDYGIPIAYCLDARRTLPSEVPIVSKKGQPWLLDPRATEAYLTDARKAIAMAKDHPSIQYIAAGDETWENLHRNLLAWLDKKDSYPEFKAIDAEIRNQYGFGKYGLPETSTDTNPFRWIATYRWEIDKMLSVQKQIRQIIQEEAPHLKMISWDSANGLRPYGISRWQEAFDIVMHQLYPSSNPKREEFGAQTRFYTDLCQKLENWPVPHIENYAASFTPKEVEELLSQCLRNGATGLSLYLADTVAERAKAANPVVDRIGSPERWNVIQAVTERITRTPVQVRQPVADTAIFYSNTSYQGTGTGEGHALQFRTHNQGEWIYTILGPRLQSAICFVDDLSVAQNPDRLQAFKAVYLPYMPIADDAEVAALEKYVEEGGFLVVCDPLAFRHRSDGSQRSTGNLLPPLENEAPMPPLGVLFQKKTLSPLSPVYSFKPNSGTPLASYPSGKVAIIETRLGKGRILFFGENPLQARVIDEAGWIQLFGYLQKQANASLVEPVWRFRLPVTPQPKSPHPEGVCLTGNAFQWQASVPKPGLNAKGSGHYQLSIADASLREPAQQPIPFEKGRLTDRLKGALAPNDADPQSFTLTWRSLENLQITYIFDSAVQTQAIRLYYSGRLPAGILEYSADGVAWEKGEPWGTEAVEEPGDLALKVINGPSQRFSHFRLNFTNLTEFQLVETDFWGKE